MDGNLYSPYRSLASSVSSHEIWAVWPLEYGYERRNTLNRASLKRPKPTGSRPAVAPLIRSWRGSPEKSVGAAYEPY